MNSAPDLSQLTSQQAVALVQGSPLVHFAGFVTIEDKNHNRVRPIPNIYQKRIDEAYELCLELGIAPRLMGLKPRQVGSSTFFGHLCYHHARRFRVDGMIIGDEGDRTEKVWQIFNGYADVDRFPWDSQVKHNTEKCKFFYSDGSVGEWEHDTANDPKAGISGTRQVVWFTEAARYAKTGARTDVKVITAVLNSLAKVKHSLAVAESTADGSNGWFYDNWQRAVSIDELREGKFGNGWVKIFAAWFEFSEHTLERSASNERYFGEDLSPRERRGLELYGWTAEQIAWRRSQIENECAGDERIFDQDFPEDDQQCFISSGRPRFNMEKLAILEKRAAVEHGLAEMGQLEKQPHSTSVIFTPDKYTGWLWVRERPKIGCAYIAAIDPCTGEQSRGARNPDAHAACVIRAPFINEAGDLKPASMVAAIHVPNGCRWDDSIIAERLARLAEWYGGCMVVPETGNGLGVLVKLRDNGCAIYRREKRDNVDPGKRHDVLGFETNSATRDLWVNALADAIREEAFDCAYKPAIEEFRTFMISDRGKSEAKRGMHDDWCTSAGLGLLFLRFASVYRNIGPVRVSTPTDYAVRSYRDEMATRYGGAFS